MSGVGLLRCLVAATALAAVAQGQSTLGSALNGQSGASFPGACPINKLSDAIVTTVATLPESTTGPLTVGIFCLVIRHPLNAIHYSVQPEQSSEQSLLLMWP